MVAAEISDVEMGNFRNLLNYELALWLEIRADICDSIRVKN